MDKNTERKAAGGVETIAAAGNTKRGNFNTAKHIDNSTHSQRMRLLEYMNTAPIDTITARRELDVMHPAARIMELKRRGYRINTVWVDRPTDCGKVHRVALYVLQPREVSDE